MYQGLDVKTFLQYLSATVVMETGAWSPDKDLSLTLKLVNSFELIVILYIFNIIGQ